MVGAGIRVLIAPFTTFYHTSLLEVLDVISVPLVTWRRLRSSGGTKGQKVGTFKIDNLSSLDPGILHALSLFPCISQ